MITPSALHFERHHAGVPDLDRSKHEILLHGLVEQPMVFTMDDLRRFPSVSRIYFVECSGNSGGEWIRPLEDPQKASGMVSCSEWTGVPLSSLLNVARLKPEAKWIVAEGADACLMARSIPLANALDDTLLVYAQNGEPCGRSRAIPCGCCSRLGGQHQHQVAAAAARHQRPSMIARRDPHYTDFDAGESARSPSTSRPLIVARGRPGGAELARSRPC